jgi:hypothetical protein
MPDGRGGLGRRTKDALRAIYVFSLSRSYGEGCLAGADRLSYRPSESTREEPDVSQQNSDIQAEGTRQPERPRPRRWLYILLTSLVAATLVAGALLIVFATNFADTYGPYPKIENRTDQTLVIFLEERDGERLRVIEVPPHSSTDLPSNCAAGMLVAVSREGNEVARRPRSNECNLENWIIEPPER